MLRFDANSSKVIEKMGLMIKHKRSHDVKKSVKAHLLKSFVAAEKKQISLRSFWVSIKKHATFVYPDKYNI